MIPDRGFSHQFGIGFAAPPGTSRSVPGLYARRILWRRHSDAIQAEVGKLNCIFFNTLLKKPEISTALP